MGDKKPASNKPTPQKKGHAERRYEALLAEQPLLTGAITSACDAELRHLIRERPASMKEAVDHLRSYSQDVAVLSGAKTRLGNDALCKIAYEVEREMVKEPLTPPSTPASPKPAGPSRGPAIG